MGARQSNLMRGRVSPAREDDIGVRGARVDVSRIAETEEEESKEEGTFCLYGRPSIRPRDAGAMTRKLREEDQRGRSERKTRRGSRSLGLDEDLAGDGREGQHRREMQKVLLTARNRPCSDPNRIAASLNHSSLERYRDGAGRTDRISDRVVRSYERVHRTPRDETSSTPVMRCAVGLATDCFRLLNFGDTFLKLP